LEFTDVSISSLIDTWLLLRDIEIGGERNRGLYILKSRGMSHSNQIREFRLSGRGIELLDVYVGSEGVLTGSARLAQEAKDKAELVLHQQEIKRKQSGLNRKRAIIEAQITDLRAEYEAEESETLKIINFEKARTKRYEKNQYDMSKSRKADIKEPVRKLRLKKKSIL
jgi:circadian clock protein KaiC